MIYIKLDGEKAVDRNAFHSYIAEVLQFPDYYGKNLDALFDCLCEISEATSISFINIDKVPSQMEQYFALIIAVFEDASDYNPNLEFTLD